MKMHIKEKGINVSLVKKEKRIKKKLRDSRGRFLDPVIPSKGLL